MCVSPFVNVDFDRPRVRDNWEAVDVGRVRLSGCIAYTVVNPLQKETFPSFWAGGGDLPNSGLPVEIEDYIPVRLTLGLKDFGR